jgi:hypothetical protein
MVFIAGHVNSERFRHPARGSQETDLKWDLWP